MSLESIKQEIQKAVDAEKSRLQNDWKEKEGKYSESLESQYLEAKNRASKLIEKEEHERYTEELLAFKMEERKKLLEQRKNIHAAILEKLTVSLEDLLGKDAYYQFIRGKVQQFSESGNTIYLSASDKKSYGDQLTKDIGHPLNICEREGLKTGVVIEKTHFNYNFSVEALLEEKRMDVENLLGKKLYEEIQESL